jgi:flavin reductase (DIM6/NTAB) family NADH-FMN oxidoreductase RutF
MAESDFSQRLVDSEVRDAFAQWAAGVTIVATGNGEERHGMTVSSFSTVSLAPPLVLVCLANTSRTLRAVTRNKHFAVSVLAEDQCSLAEGFAGVHPQSWAPFQSHPWARAVTGSPFLERSLAWFDCRLWAVYPEGDHSIVLGRAERLGSNPRGRPLLYGNRAFAAASALATA